MSVSVLERPATQSGPEPTTGGVPARRAMLRWSWRLFKREWRQQFLILLLIIVAVAAVVVGSAVAVNTPPPANAGFGTAHDLATFNLTPTNKAAKDSPAYVDAQIAMLEHDFGTTQVISNETFSVPGSNQTYQLRAMDPNGPYAKPMIQLLSGHYPTGSNQIALTPGLASQLNLRIGDTWSEGGKTVVGIVQNPQSLLDSFALVPPGQVTHPTEVSVLFDTSPSNAKNVPSYVTTPGSTNTNIINPATIILALATVGMLLIALVSIGGFTVLAQRRMRSLGMLESMGATDRNVRLVLEANGVIVGFVGAIVGFALGLVLWLAYRPHNEQSAHHVISMFALPWNVIAPAMVLAVIATFFAAGYPARAITRVPVVTALAGRPAPPRQIHRSLVPGVVALVVGFIMFSISGASGNGGGVIWLVPGLIALIVGIILVSPFFLALLARIGAKSPIAIRLPLRDMARYRARSGSALSAISLGIMIAVIVCAVAVARYANVFDYVGPNMAANTINVYTAPTGPTFGPGGQTQQAQPAPSLSAAGGNRARHRLCRRRQGRRRARPAGGGAAESEHERPAMERGDLRRDAGPLAVVRHQSVVDPVQRRRTELTARAGRLGRPAHLRGRRQGGRRLPGTGRSGRAGRGREQLQPVHAQPVHRPPGDSGGEPAAHRHVGPEHGHHGERAAPATHRGPEQPRRVDGPVQQHHHLGPADECAIPGRRGRPERRVEERRADLGRDRELGDRLWHRPRPGRPRHERGSHPQRDGERVAHAHGDWCQFPHPARA